MPFCRYTFCGGACTTIVIVDTTLLTFDEIYYPNLLPNNLHKDLVIKNQKGKSE